MVATHCRSWALPYSLSSLVNQRRPPDEVVVVLKPCGDGSEGVVSGFAGALPLRLIVQNSGGGVADAYELGYLNATGDIVLFMDDDAVAHEEWVLRYERLFGELPDAGGIGGIVYRAYLDGGRLVRTSERFREKRPTRGGPHRRPLPELEGYYGWVSTSGFMGERACDRGLCPSVLLSGANMGFRTSAIRDLGLSALYRGSRRGFWFESFMAYWCVRRGFRVYEVMDEGVAPAVWHIEHGRSLTRERGFWGEFWLYYDAVVAFWRLRRMGAKVSLPRYLLALAIGLRRRTLPRLLATLYGLLRRA